MCIIIIEISWKNNTWITYFYLHFISWIISFTALTVYMLVMWPHVGGDPTQNQSAEKSEVIRERNNILHQLQRIVRLHSLTDHQLNINCHTSDSQDDTEEMDPILDFKLFHRAVRTSRKNLFWSSPVEFGIPKCQQYIRNVRKQSINKYFSSSTFRTLDIWLDKILSSTSEYVDDDKHIHYLK